MSDALAALIVLGIPALIGVAVGVWARGVWKIRTSISWRSSLGWVLSLRKYLGLALILAGAAFVVDNGPGYILAAQRGHTFCDNNAWCLEPPAWMTCGVVLLIAGIFTYRAGRGRRS